MGDHELLIRLVAHHMVAMLQILNHRLQIPMNLNGHYGMILIASVMKKNKAQLKLFT